MITRDAEMDVKPSGVTGGGEEGEGGVTNGLMQVRELIIHMEWISRE